MKQTLSRLLTGAVLILTCVMGRAVNNPPCNGPAITGFTGNQTFCPGDTITVTVVATGTAPLHYVWKKNGTVIGGDSPTITDTTTSENDASAYSVRVYNNCGDAVGYPPLSPLPPVITQQPENMTVYLGTGDTGGSTVTSWVKTIGGGLIVGDQANFRV
ncbi:MAG TPA: immunoglobulin domain-containing protein, partial [Dongiaceae bacterium]|nr:immunoglobulin domain-containing protein [Dongiaceae bacterium]